MSTKKTKGRLDEPGINEDKGFVGNEERQQHSKDEHAPDRHDRSEPIKISQVKYRGWNVTIHDDTDKNK